MILTGCTRYEPSEEMTVAKESQTEPETGQAQEAAEPAEVITISKYPPRARVKVKGIYVSAYVAGTGDMMDKIIEEIDRTELNAVVIDVKDDQGRITFHMDSPTVNKIGACQPFIGDLPGLIQKLDEHGIYPIARVVAFRDPYLAEQKPEWSLHVADGSIYRDNKGLAWVNPYKKEVWDYLIEVSKKAGEMGFKEIQFDYIRFAVDKTMKDVVFDEADTGDVTRPRPLRNSSAMRMMNWPRKGYLCRRMCSGPLWEVRRTRRPWARNMRIWRSILTISVQ